MQDAFACELLAARLQFGDFEDLGHEILPPKRLTKIRCSAAACFALGGWRSWLGGDASAELPFERGGHLRSMGLELLGDRQPAVTVNTLTDVASAACGGGAHLGATGGAAAFELAM
jgi:hypothetical protein